MALQFRERVPLQFHLPAVIAGLFVAVGIQIVCTAFGLGVTFFNKEATEDGAFSIGLLVWSGLSWTIAAFVGGYVTAWVADSTRYVGGLFHGLALWGLLTFVVMFLPPSTSAAADTILSASVIASVAWFVSIGGLFSMGSSIWGAIIGSHVVEQVEAKKAETHRAA